MDIPSVLGGGDLINKQPGVKNISTANSTTATWGKIAGFAGLVHLLKASSSILLGSG